jgi:hypothetical protein
MTAKRLLVTSALLLGTTLGTATVTLAQDYYVAPYGYGHGYAPGYGPGYAPGYPGPGVYNYTPYYGYGPSRGGPGPRVGNGTGAGIGSQR